MDKVLLVGLGGAIGSMARYGVGGAVGRLKAGWEFPIETLLINVVGCLVIGTLAGWSEARGVFSGNTRAFLFIGLLGGFTTFSTFGYEAFQLMRDAQWLRAGMYVGLHMVAGLVAVWGGWTLAQLPLWSAR